MASSSGLLPKEHGAYAELTFPLLTGLTLAAPSWPALALAGGAVAFFLAHEPVAVLLGVRGKRIRDQVGDRAGRRLALLLGLGVVLGGTGVLGADPGVRWTLLAPAGAALLLIPTVLAGKQKTIPGELLVVTAFTSFLVPVALSSGVSRIHAILAAAVWWISFALGTLEVHAIKARLKKGKAARDQKRTMARNTKGTAAGLKKRATARSHWTIWGSPLASGLAVAGALWLALGQASPLLRAWARGSVARAGGAMGPGPPLASEPGDGMRSWALDALPALPPAAAALLPPALTIFVLSLIKVHPKHLKRVGWTLVGANTLTYILLLQG